MDASTGASRVALTLHRRVRARTNPRERVVETTARVSRNSATSEHTELTDENAPTTSRRAVFALCASVAIAVDRAGAARAMESSEELQRELGEAYSRRDFATALRAARRLRELEPGLTWTEAEAQISVDAKKFDEAIGAYDDAYAMCEGDAGAAARVLAGRGLAREGVYDFANALKDYDEVLRLCAEGGFAPDPYTVNARGNVKGSLGDWAGARNDYNDAARLFQGAKGFKNGMSTTQRLDGAIYAQANAALASVQLGEEQNALKSLEGLVRRAPNSADARAAVASLYYASGRFEDAEEMWVQACSREIGCAQYKDIDYVTRIRRWPPAMVEKLKSFLAVS